MSRYQCTDCRALLDEWELDTDDDTVSMPYGDRPAGITHSFYVCPDCGCDDLTAAPAAEDDEPEPEDDDDATPAPAPAALDYFGFAADLARLHALTIRKGGAL